MNQIIKLSDKDYFSFEGISNSSLLLFDRSPAHLQVGLKRTDSMTDGKTAHAFLLDNFQDYVAAPLGVDDKRKKDFKDFQNSTDKEIILYSEYEKLQTIRQNLDKYELYPDLNFGFIRDNAQKEISMFYEDTYNGEHIQKKGKADILYEMKDSNIIIDLKKTENCLDFFWAVKRYKLYRQCAWYSDVATGITGKKTIFIFMSFEYEPPFACKAYILSDEWIELGRKENENSVLNYMKWRKEGSEIKGYPEGIEIINLQKYF